MSAPNGTKVDVQELRRELYALLAYTDLPQPLSVTLQPEDHGLGHHGTLRLDDNRPEAVDAWVAAYAPGRTATHSRLFKTTPGQPAWRDYGADDVGIAGWRLRVWSPVDEEPLAPGAGA